jgi:tetratricopeptide (TPR) repeat protein
VLLSPVKTLLMKNLYFAFAAQLHIILVLGCTAATAQEMPVTASERGREIFIKVRQAHQVAWFEKTDDLIREAMVVEPDMAMLHAYASVLDYLLYRDPTASVAKARELAGNLQGPEKRMVDALVLYAEENYEGVEAALKDVLAVYPNDPYARHRLGAVQISAGRHEEGVATLRALIKDQPDYPGAWNHLGYGLLALNRTDEALDAFRNFLAGSAGNPSAHHSYGEGLLRAGEVDAAIGHFTRATLIEPRFAYAWLHMGVILQEEGSDLQAYNAYLRAGQASELYGERFKEAVRKRIEAVKP